MRATEKKLLEFMAYKNTMIIPVYQRNYTWGEEECKRLFQDIVKIHKNSLCSYFMGAVVSVASGQNEIILIDGQQRMTSMSLLLLAICNLLDARKIKSNDENLRDKIWESYLVDRYKKDGEDGQWLRLKQVNKDEQAYKILFTGGEITEKLKATPINKNYKYFAREILALYRNDSNIIDELWDAFNKLEIVAIELDLNSGDKPQVVFETINATGKRLEDADLIRNYLLMDQDKEVQEEWFKKYWTPIEQNTYKNQKSSTTYAIWYYLMYKEKCSIQKGEIYSHFREYINEITKNCNPEESVVKKEEFLQELTRFTGYYKWFNDNCELPRLEKYFDIFRKLGQSTPYSYFMSLMNLYENKKDLTEDNVCEILEFILNYYIRRSVLGYGTNTYAVFYSKLAEKIKCYTDKNINYLESLHRVFSNVGHADQFPEDHEIKVRLLTENFYKPRNFMNKLVLEKIYHDDLDSNEEKTTIEQIMPKNLTPQWKKDLGENWEEIYNKYVNTIGNLILIEADSKCGTKQFSEKQKIFRDSNISFNRYLATITAWNENSITENAKRMIELFIKAYPDIPNRANYREVQEYKEKGEFIYLHEFEPKGEKPEAYRFIDSKRSKKCSSWKKLLVEVCKELYDFEKKLFRDIAKSNRHFSNNPNNFREPRQITDDLYCESNASAESICKLLEDMLKKCGFYDDFLVKLKEK